MPLANVRITPQASIPHPYFFLTSRHSQEFAQPPDWFTYCWAAPHRPTNLVVAQPQDGRKGLEIVTETSAVYQIGKSYMSEAPHYEWLAGRQAGRPQQRPLLLREEGSYHFKWELKSGWLLSYRGNLWLEQEART